MAINLQEEYNNTNIQGIIDQLENDLVGLTPVKQRIKEIAALLFFALRDQKTNWLITIDML